MKRDELFFVNSSNGWSLHAPGDYKARADVKAVFHFHSPAVVLLSVIGQTIRRCTTTARFFTRACRSTPARGRLNRRPAGEMAKLLGDAKALMLRGHGAVVVGQSIREVCMLGLFLEESARLQAEAMRLAHPCSWSATRPKRSPNELSSPLPWNVLGITSR